MTLCNDSGAAVSAAAARYWQRFVVKYLGEFHLPPLEDVAMVSLALGVRHTLGDHLH